MLTAISILTSLGFAVCYPFCFLIHANSPIRSGFHKFHLGMPLVVGGVVFVCLLAGAVVSLIKGLLAIWFFPFAFLTFFYWNREYPNSFVIAVPSLFGLLAFTRTQSELLGGLPLKGGVAVTGILAGLILCASLHSMMLGHHYLNVKGLPIWHLRRATYILWGLLGLRILWDLYLLFYGRVMHGGDQIAIGRFLMTLEGFLLWIGIFFGTLFPFTALFFVKEIIKVRNTQAATGLLYVVLSSVLMGDLTYKYYLVKYGVVL